MSTRTARAPRAEHRCAECGWSTPRWVGRCGQCQAWGSLTEATPLLAGAPRGAGAPAPAAPARAARRASEVVAQGRLERLPTGLAEVDRVVGGGLVPGQVLLLAGEPGAGKSTLLLAVADAVAAAAGPGAVVLYVSAEESVEQIAVRARRTGARSETLLLADDTDLGAVLGHVEQLAASSERLALLVVDSVQTVSSSEVEGRPGGVAQVMAVASALTRLAKERGLPVCLVGQVTKETTVAGPRSLEHLVDTTLTLEGDRHTALRLLRAVKNRYGPADEVACFEQTDTGLREVPDPSSLFRGTREVAVPGTCTTVTLEGRRALLAEVQALVSGTQAPIPRRAVSGLDTARTAMLTAVTEKNTTLTLHAKELYVAAAGGMRLADPATDLAVCLAVASAGMERPLPLDVAALGEVALAGDVRPVPGLQARAAEAVRLGHTRLLVPPGAADLLDTRTRAAARLEVVASLGDAVRLLLSDPSTT
ncbi:DNA repair protein RadA [Quadrisphaera granulorum]|uniref:DNA repair protein RadA n=1 Tax=Quadrisphaera granulorum TaxID=317664 RepID=UPI000D6D8EA9|nr:DNA repair protein RadA [Quadrisphaera granulorum]